MRAGIYQGPGNVEIDDVAHPELDRDDDAVVQVSHAAICGSDLWAYRGVEKLAPGARLGHEFIGIVTELGSAAGGLERGGLRLGDTVIAPFLYSCGACVNCERDLPSSCVRGGIWGGAQKDGRPVDGGQGESVRVPLAASTLVRVENPGEFRSSDLLALTDVMSTGYHSAVTGDVGPDTTVAIVGDGAVGVSAVAASRLRGARRIAISSRHPSRASLARRFGASEVVAERGAEAVQELFGDGADVVIEAVGTQEALEQAVASSRPGGVVVVVGVPHLVQGAFMATFKHNISIRGGKAPTRLYIPDLLDAVRRGQISPGDVFDTELPLDRLAEGYELMDRRDAIKVMLTV